MNTATASRTRKAAKAEHTSPARKGTATAPRKAGDTRKPAKAAASAVKAAPATAASTAKAEPAKAEQCRDWRCEAGVTACRGCRGHGVLRANGKHYRYRTPVENVSANATKHAPCKGTGKRRCGCQRLDAATSRAIGKQQTEAELAA